VLFGKETMLNGRQSRVKCEKCENFEKSFPVFPVEYVTKVRTIIFYMKQCIRWVASHFCEAPVFLNGHYSCLKWLGMRKNVNLQEWTNPS
jgi:hypothetical protein